MSQQRLFFIGGASVSGKTTLAKKIGTEIGLPWLSADYIHDMALAVGVRDQSPETFRIRDLTAEAFYDTHTIEEVVESEIVISHETWNGIQALIDAGFEGIIEGVAVIPELVRTLQNRSDTEVHAVYLVNDDHQEILQIAMQRGIWDAAHMYPDHVKEKEVDFVLAYNTYLKAEAEKYKFPIINTERTDAVIAAAKQALNIV